MIKTVENKYSSRMNEIVRKADAVFPSNIPGWNFPLYESEVYFDLDYIWANPSTLEDTANLIITVVKNEKMEFDLLGGVTSRTGSFGTVPIATVIANKSSLPLAVFDEEEISGFEAHPHSLSRSVIIKGKRVLLIKDVVVGGSSLSRILSSIKRHSGKVGGIIVLVDFSIIENRYQAVPESIPVLKFLSEKDFNKNHIDQ